MKLATTPAAGTFKSATGNVRKKLPQQAHTTTGKIVG
jgi:hypothetical protein